MIDIKMIVESYLSIFGDHDDIYGRGTDIVVSRLQGEPYLDRYLDQEIPGDNYVQVLVDIGETPMPNLNLERQFKTVYDSRYPSSKYTANLNAEQLKQVKSLIDDWFRTVDLRRVEYWTTPILPSIGDTYGLINDSSIVVLPINRLYAPVTLEVATELVFYKPKIDNKVDETLCSTLVAYGLLFHTRGYFQSMQDLKSHCKILKSLSKFKTMGRPVEYDLKHKSINIVAH